MYRLTISREYFSDLTIGTMIYNGVEICRCMELPRSLKPATIGCIPEGEYPVLIRRTNELGLHLWIADVPVRGHILVNSAHNTKELQGRSIIPVKGFSDRGVGLFSSEAMDTLMKVLKPDLFTSKPVTLFVTSKTPGYEIKALSKFTGNHCTLSAAQ